MSDHEHDYEPVEFDDGEPVAFLCEACKGVWVVTRTSPEVPGWWLRALES